MFQNVFQNVFHYLNSMINTIEGKRGRRKAIKAKKKAKKSEKKKTRKAKKAKKKETRNAKKSEKAKKKVKKNKIDDEEVETQTKIDAKEKEKQAIKSDKEKEKQAKIDAKEKEKQAKIDAKEKEKQAEIDAKEKEIQARIAAKEAEIQAEIAAKEKEIQAIKADNRSIFENLKKKYTNKVKDFETRENLFVQKSTEISSETLANQINFYNEYLTVFENDKKEIENIFSSINKKYKGTADDETEYRNILTSIVKPAEQMIDERYKSIEAKLQTLGGELNLENIKQKKIVICKKINSNIDSIENELNKYKSKFKKITNNYNKCSDKMKEDCPSLVQIKKNKTNTLDELEKINDFLNDKSNKDEIKECKLKEYKLNSTCKELENTYYSLSNDFDKYYSEYNYLNTSYNDCTDEFANKCSNTLYSLNTKQSNLKTSLETTVDQLPNDISENFELITKGIPDNAKYDLKKYYIYSLLGTVGLYTIYNEF